MDWTKINQKEVNYFCTLWHIDFDCYPLIEQVDFKYQSRVEMVSANLRRHNF